MFNVYDPKTIVRGSVPVLKLPREQELILLRSLANPADPNVPERTRKWATKALFKLQDKPTKASREYHSHINFAFLLLRLLRSEDRKSLSTENSETARLLEEDMTAAHDTYYFGPPQVHKILLQSWDVYVCQLPSHVHRTRHLVGKINHYGEIVVTTALISINSVTREAESETGEIYVFGGQVQGSPGVDTKWSWWRDKHGATEVKCITQEVKDALLSNRERE
jgi:hypothetical protein